AAASPPLFAGRAKRYTVFDDASKTVTFDESQTICASPASDWSSRRPRPSFVSQSRPDAPDISADPAGPRSAPDGKRRFVNLILAVIPSGSGAASASCSASGRALGGGVGPPLRAATASAAPPA